MALVMIASSFTACGKDNKSEDDPATTTTITDVMVNGDDSTTFVNEEITVTTETKDSSSTTTTKKSNQNPTTTKKNEAPTKAPTTTKKPETTTMVITQCSHTFSSWKYVNNKTEREHTCTKCGYSEIDVNYRYNPNDWMGSNAEYNQLLKLVNNARKNAGLNELVYVTKCQQGANTRAIELTESFSHTRPNGKSGLTAYGSFLSGTSYVASNENIFWGANASSQDAFNSWINSAGHRANILSEYGQGFCAARCDGYWVMTVLCY